jgi:hypothetical protein
MEDASADSLFSEKKDRSRNNLDSISGYSPVAPHNTTELVLFLGRELNIAL